MGAAHLAVWIAARTPADAAVVAPAAMAAEGPPGVDSLAQYGVLGILGAALLWFAFRAYQREVQRADQKDAEIARKDAEIARLNTVIQEQALPAVLAATEVVKDYHNLLRDQRHLQRPDPRNGVWRQECAPTAGHGDGDR